MLVAGALLAGCRGSDPPARDGSGKVTEAGDLPVNEARIGDCYDEEEEGSDRTSTLAAVPCGVPHDREVFHRFDLAGDRYPGVEAVSREAAQACLDAFVGYVGVAYADSVLDAHPIVPSEETWEDDDDRTVVCVVGQEGGRITGSLAGAAR